MALMQCPECGNKVSDKAEKCPKCGCPVSRINELQRSKKEKNGYLVAGIIAVFVIGGAGIFFGTSDMRQYNQALKNYKKGDYEIATKEFKELKTYKDSKNMYKESRHMLKVSNDKDIPEIVLSENELNFYTGDSFDFDEWAESNVLVTDNVTEKIDYSVSGDTIDMEKSGKYVVEISATDEAGNTATEEVTVNVSEKPSKVYEAYVDAKNVRVDSLKKNSSTGRYSYNGIGIIASETDWLDTAWGKNAEYLDSAALFRSLAKKVEGFYALGKSMYGNWKGNVPTIFNIDAPGSWDEMKPYVDKIFPYMISKNYLKPMVYSFSKLSSFEGKIDFENGVYDFKINDVEKAATELGVNDEMFGYMLAALEDYAPEVSFEGKQYQFSLKSNIQAGKVTYDDYNAYNSDGEHIEKFTYNYLKDTYGEDGGYQYFFFDEDIDPTEEGVITTARGIQIGSGKELVTAMYGKPSKEVSNKKKNALKEEMEYALSEEYYNCYNDVCENILVYNYEDKGQITFWIDKNNEVSGLGYSNYIMFE